MIKKGRSERLTHSFYIDDELVDSGDVEVTVKNADNEILHSGPASLEGNIYSFILPAITELGPITITWSGEYTDTTNEEIVGDYLFELYELKSRMQTRGLKKTYPNELLKEVRAAVVDTFEAVTNVGFIARRKTVRVEVVGGTGFLPTASVLNVHQADGETFSGTWTPTGRVDGLEGHSALVTYDYGLPFTAEAKANAVELAIYLLSEHTRTTPDNAVSFTDTSGNTYRYATAGMRGAEVSIPQVDAFLKRFKFDLPGVA